MKLSIIAALSKNYVIGKDNKIPWVIKSDLKRFAELTSGHTVVMGLSTYLSILETLGNPLKNRTSVVLSDKEIENVPEEVKVFRTPDELISHIKKINDEVFVIGGGQIYKLFIPMANKLYLTHVNTLVEGDTYFPEFNKKQWNIINTQKYKKSQNDEYDYEFIEYGRKNEYVFLPNARTEDQKKIMEDIANDGVCPFCTHNLKKYHHKEILKEGKYWLLTYNQWPYENTKVHLLAIFKKHAEKLADLPNDSGSELFEFLKWAEKEFNVKSGGFAMRFGEASGTGGSVSHIHVQFLVPDHNKKDFTPIRFKIG